MFVGLDGCAKGWVAVRLDDNGTREIDFLPDLKDCLNSSFTRAMIDIPIGLPDSQYRNCDLEGRKLLGEKSIPLVQRRPSSAAFIRKARRRSRLGKSHRRHWGLVSAFLSVAEEKAGR
jgi:predicted RNase H-like nuclease